jgi:hypothetical protein
MTARSFTPASEEMSRVGRRKLPDNCRTLVMRMSKVDWLLLPFLVAGTVALTSFAFRVAGFLGVGILGVWLSIVAVLTDEDPIRSAENRSAPRSAAPQAERWWLLPVQGDALAAVLFGAKVASAGMIILGFGLYFEVQRG